MYWSDTSYVYVLILLLAAGTTTALAYYAWQRHAAPGAIAFAILMLAVAGWSVGYALELGVSDLATKTVWAKVQYLGIVAVPLAWVAFALPYTRREQWLTPRHLALLAIIPLVTLLLVWTNETHGLIWSRSSLDISGPFPALDVTYGPWFWLHSAYSYLLLFLGTLWFILMLLRSPQLYRHQASALLLAVLAPWVGNALYLSGLGPVPNLDLTPFAFAISGLFFALGLFRFGLLDLVPVARRAVVEGMSDGVIVLDMQNRIVDINRAAKQMIGPAVSNPIGSSVTTVLADYVELIETNRNATETSSEISLVDGESERHFDVHISTLTDRQNHDIGRVVVLHDITSLKQTEKNLRDQKQLFESLVAVARATAEQPTVNSTLQNALDVATSLTGAEIGSMFLLDESGVVTHHISAHGMKTPAQGPDYVGEIMDKGLAGWVARHRQPALISDTTYDDRWLPLPAEYPLTIHAALAVPIVGGSSALGILTLAHSTIGYFNIEHLELMQAAADQIALAVRNAQIFEAQRRMVDRQVTLYEVIRTVAEQTEPDQVARVAAETIKQYAGWPNVIIALPDKGQNQWKACAASGTLSALMGQQFPIGPDIISLAFKTAKTQIKQDVKAEPDDHIYGLSNIGSVLAVPLRRGRRRVLGVLALASQQPAAFDADDLFLAESVAEAVALILDNARLHAETQRRLKEQTALREVSAVITSSLDLSTVLNRLAEQLGQAVDVTSTQIFEYEPETATATGLANYIGSQATAQENTVDLNRTYDLAHDFPNLINSLDSGQPAVNHLNNPGLSGQQHAYMQQLGVQTTLTIPLQIRGETIAYAELRESRQPREFTAEEIEFCQGIAQQAAIALENVRIYDEAHQHAAGLSALYTITRMVNRSLSLEDVLPQALSSALLLLGFDAGSISVINPTNGRLDTVAEYGFPSVLPTYIRRGEMDQPLGQHVFAHQDVLMITDLKREAPIDVSNLVTLGFKSYVGIPLLLGEQALGVINLFTRHHRPTSFEEMALLTTIGNQVAVAVANVRLFQTIADERSRLRALIDSSRDGIILVGMDQRVLVMNAPVLEYLSLSGNPEDWTDRPIQDVLTALRPHGRAAVKATVAEMHRIQQGNEPPGEGEYEISPRTIHWSNFPVLAGTTPLGRLIVLRDVTEERSLEKMREDLTHTMVHDLRNPLTDIIG